MSNRQLSCLSWVRLPDADVMWLTSLPGAAHEVPQRVWCELEVGHADRHAGLGQDSFDGRESTTWWIWWPDGGDHEIGAAVPCPAWQPDADSLEFDEDAREPCLLPANHSGRHSFQL